MKKLTIAVACAALLCVAAVGCKKQQSGGAGSGQTGDMPAVAGNFQDGHHAFWGGQEKCPVCGKKPLKQKHHADVQNGRIYFDRAECKKKFTQNKDKYLKKMKDMLRSSMERSK